MHTETLSVPEVHCGHCIGSIEGALAPMAGVTAATVDLATKTVTVTYDEATVQRAALVDAIVEQGYEVAG